MSLAVTTATLAPGTPRPVSASTACKAKRAAAGRELLVTVAATAELTDVGFVAGSATVLSARGRFGRDLDDGLIECATKKMMATPAAPRPAAALRVALRQAARVSATSAGRAGEAAAALTRTCEPMVFASAAGAAC